MAGGLPPGDLGGPFDGHVGATAALAERFGAVWASLEPCLEGARQGGFRAPEAVRGLDDAFAKLTAALEEHPLGIAWDVTPTAFEIAGAPMWAPARPPLDDVCPRLFAEGLRRVRVEPGLTRDELAELLRILTRGATPASAEDEAPSELWDADFTHVTYVAIDDDVPLEALPEVAAISARARSLAGRANEPPDAITLPADKRAALAAQLGVGEEAFGPRFVDTLAEGYLKARGGPAVQLVEGAIREWAEDPARDAASSFAFFGTFARALAARAPSDASALEREAMRMVVPVTAVKRLLESLARSGDDPWAADKGAPDATVVSGLSQALSLVGDGSLLDVACRSWTSLPPGPLRDAVHAYVRAWATGNEARLGAELEAAGAELGVVLVNVLASLGTPAALGALERAAKSREIAVRLEALVAMPPGRDEYVRGEVKRLLHDPDAAVWTRALAAVSERGLLAAGPAIVAQIQAPSFHDRPLDDRRAWLRGLAKLSPRRAEELSSELLAQTPLIPSESLEQSRALAAEILGECGSTKEALATCEEAVKKRWRNSQAVRDAAERSAAEIAKRLASTTPEPPVSRQKPGAP